MDRSKLQSSRRRFLLITKSGLIIPLTGCLGRNGNGEEPYDRPPDWCVEELSGPVPDAENTSSIDGVPRKDQSNLQSKTEVAYQCMPLENQQCGSCTFFIDDKTGDGIGACTEVEGGIRGTDWCSLWAPKEEMSE
ncbi:high-potential iron-sulfur protein [Natronococcus wangiae]|uniref:high-potential iron-sulfur protein n=1 Tax=Natronococcus wangiae TaxID=3068275 RepID=UPI00273DD4BC|nr:high-potential iron-sulfur protein [Natronococcus sp. AD5]